MTIEKKDLKRLKGEEGFHKFYESIYQTRWPQIFKAMQVPVKMLKWNPKTKDDPEYYFQDPASKFLAEQLPLRPNDKILDMCAAPGGKSLTLINRCPQASEYLANDLSRNRRERMKRVFNQFLPEELCQKIHITGYKGENFGLYKKNYFDAILLDAPCSSERHVVEQPKYFKEWSYKRTLELSRRQYSLFCSALLSLKLGGYLLYATCSLSPLENDGVIARAKEKGKGFEVIEIEISDEFEKTEFGYSAMPDKCGFGPMYFCLVKKV